MKIKYHPTARQEVQVASSNHRKISPALENRFLNELGEIERSLHDEDLVKTVFRSTNFKVFSYDVIYDVSPDYVTICATRGNYQNDEFYNVRTCEPPYPRHRPW
ncbi:MAG: mRNA-degrading endonuclease RelE of RelBE toxin-antitoxin system [Akkermansiaceae bacterium]